MRSRSAYLRVVQLLWGLAAFLIMPASPALATPNSTTWATITELQAGWHDPTVKVKLSVAFYNPESCINADGYMTDPAVAGTQLFNSILLTAFSQNRQVALVIDGCFLGRPKIISVAVRP